MMRGLWAAATGMEAQQNIIDVISNNLANANTPGFKKSRANFQDLMYQTLQVAGDTTPAGGQVPTGIQLGMGVKLAGVQKIFTQGNYVQTGNNLDMAIEGNGFFQVISGDRTLYTRAGDFMLDSQGYITDQDGDRLQPETAIPSNAATVSIQSNGMLTAYDSNNKELMSAQLELYNFVNPAGLYAEGRNLFSPTPGSGDAIEGTPGTDNFGTISSGYLEMSNVSVVQEIVNMIAGQRAYEADSKTIQTADTMLQDANNIKQ